MLHIVDITENDYDSYIFNHRRHYITSENSGIVKNDYLVLRWDNNSILFFVNDVDNENVVDNYVICSLIPCHIEIDDISYVSRIENNEHDNDFSFVSRIENNEHDDDFYNLPFL